MLGRRLTCDANDAPVGLKIYMWDLLFSVDFIDFAHKPRFSKIKEVCPDSPGTAHTVSYKVRRLLTCIWTSKSNHEFHKFIGTKYDYRFSTGSLSTLMEIPGIRAFTEVCQRYTHAGTDVGPRLVELLALP